MTANDRPQGTKKGYEYGNAGQSGGLKLMTGVGPQHTTVTKIWFGETSNPPGFRSLPHHCLFTTSQFLLPQDLAKGRDFPTPPRFLIVQQVEVVSLR